jgi:uncharacterized UBP type Zn finger protein
MADTCEHFEELETVADPHGSVCRECIEMGDTWVHLRSCLGCGHVGCCDNSKNRHARRHWEQHNHPLIQSQEPGESWRYCFADRVLVE